MKQSKLFLAILVIMGVLSSCKSKQQFQTPDVGRIGPTVQNSRTSYDWPGTYTGVVPCADCSGIAVELTLNSDLTYVQKLTYDNNPAKSFTHSSSFTWNDAGTDIALKGDREGEGFDKYIVLDGKLILLDINGELISGESINNYILTKGAKAVAVHSELTGKRWKLVELMGQPVSYSEGQTEAYITFSVDGKVSGNGGCNGFGGTYTLQDGNRIRFSQMVATLKMCLDMTTETGFLKVLETADNYNLNGDKLVLNRARMAPLARFEAVYMQ
ncbi:hypothetical protein AGMMS50262_21930 [Bacteroidia bacterium]|nr:hypothetical protein AGMMS50262_21930 [Bacteroidia bacterium]